MDGSLEERRYGSGRSGQGLEVVLQAVSDELLHVGMVGPDGVVGVGSLEPFDDGLEPLPGLCFVLHGRVPLFVSGGYVPVSSRDMGVIYAFVGKCVRV